MSEVTPLQMHVLKVLAKHNYVYPRLGINPASLAQMVWPDRNHRCAAAPGSGQVRPMLATLARLRKKNLVSWWSVDGKPGRWGLTSRGNALAMQVSDAR